MVAAPEVLRLSPSLASVWRLRAMALARSASNRASAASPIIKVSLFLNLKQYVSQIWTREHDDLALAFTSLVTEQFTVTGSRDRFVTCH